MSGRRRDAVRWLAAVGAGVFMVVLAPVVLVAGAGNPPCQIVSPETVTTPAGAAGGGMFAQPLELQPDHWYRVGATEYGGPSDPGSGEYAASGVYLPAYPDSFAELSLLDSNPANTGAFTFADANALGNLPFGTSIRVANGVREQVLVKRDVGYGQGPGQTIPYRIDVWHTAAAELGITKTPVEIELAPASGTAATLDQLPTPASANQGGGCASNTVQLTLTAGQSAQILPDGQATAPADAPAAVKDAIAAGNQLIDKPYLYRGTGVGTASRSPPWRTAMTAQAAPVTSSMARVCLATGHRTQPSWRHTVGRGQGRGSPFTPTVRTRSSMSPGS
ncbi:MAG: hypothetical protein ACP5H2_01980 [Solirubrobacteraceae bacterium]